MEGRVSNNEAVGAELTRDDPQADAKGLANDSRFYCPYPGCNRSFAELWRLKVHYRAPPDIRGSGKERGHGTELTHCPKCNKTLKPGKHHVGCSGGKTAPRQAIKRSRMGSDTGSGFDEDLADGPTSNQVRLRKSEGAGDGGPADVHGTAPFGHDFSAGAYASGPPLYDQDGQPRQDWAQVHAPPPAMFYPPQPGMAYWPDPNNPMNGYMPHPGMAPYPAQFMGPPQPYPGHPGMPQPYPGYPMMPGQVPPPNYMPPSGVAQNTVVMQQPVAPGVQQNSMPGLSPLQQSQQHQQQQQQQQPPPQQAHQAPQHQQGPQPPPMPQQQHAGSHLQSQGQGQQQSAPHQPAQPAQPAHQQPHERSTAAASASGQSDALGSDGMFDIEEFAKDFGRIPSPPPLPPDFHAATGGTSMLFNFAQFSQRLQRTQSFTALDRELAAAGLELPDPSLLYDHTDDGDIMQLLFGVPDDVPTMATIHIHAHKWNEDDDTGSVGPSLAMSQQQPQPSSTGRPAASQLGQQHSSQQQQQQQQLQQQGHPSMVSSHPGVQPLQAPTHQVLVPEQLQEAHTTQQQQHQLLPPSGMDHHVQHGELTNGSGGDSLLSGSMASTGNRKILGAGKDLRGDDVLASHLAPPKAAESRAVVCSQDDHHHHSRDNLLDAETFQLLQSCD